jgi:hypothetical protein
MWDILPSIIRYCSERQVPLVEQKLLTLPDHLSSPPVFSGVRVTRFFALCVCFVDRCLSYCTFSFGHCVVFSSTYTDSDYSFGFFLFRNIYSSIFVRGLGRELGSLLSRCFLWEFLLFDFLLLILFMFWSFWSFYVSPWLVLASDSITSKVGS